MKAAVIERYGDPQALELRDVAKPRPKADEVLVRVHAASINDWDWGLLQGTPFVNRVMVGGLFRPKVRIIGGDIAGRVETVGRDVKTFEPGDEVHGDLCMSGFGAFAEYVCAPEACLVHVHGAFRRLASPPWRAVSAVTLCAGIYEDAALRIKLSRNVDLAPVTQTEMLHFPDFTPDAARITVGSKIRSCKY